MTRLRSVDSAMKPVRTDVNTQLTNASTHAQKPDSFSMMEINSANNVMRNAELVTERPQPAAPVAFKVFIWMQQTHANPAIRNARMDAHMKLETV